MISIPGQVFVEIETSEIPPGPAGLSAYQVWLANNHVGSEADFLNWLRDGMPSVNGTKISHASITTSVQLQNSTWQPTGLACQIEVQPGDNVLIDVTGFASHWETAICYFTLFRNGIDITPSGCTALSVVRSDAGDSAKSIAFKHKDTPPQSGNVTYELKWSSNNAALSYLGRRPGDTNWQVPTTMTLTAYK